MDGNIFKVSVRINYDIHNFNMYMDCCLYALCHSWQVRLSKQEMSIPPKHHIPISDSNRQINLHIAVGRVRFDLLSGVMVKEGFSNVPDQNSRYVKESGTN